MKNLLAKSILVLALGATMQAAIAYDVPYTTINMEKILSSLQTAGCTAIKEIEYDDGVYKADAVCAQGQYVKIRLDSATGKIISPKLSNEKRLSMMEAVKAVEAVGYTHIYKIETKSQYYKIKAIDSASNKKVELEVNATTGKISKDWF